MSAWEAGMDDQIVKGEFHLPVGREVEFVFRSRDVIHSAYMPHFRAQMNTVPGVPTRFKMTPTITTDSMRTVLDDPDFDYVLLCNKVCGAAHFNMQMKLVIDTEEQFEAWLLSKTNFLVKEGEEEPEMEQLPPTRMNLQRNCIAVIMGAHAHHHEESFISKYVFSHDHKMISKQFLVTAL